jgi:hypothetical protein
MRLVKIVSRVLLCIAMAVAVVNLSFGSALGGGQGGPFVEEPKSPSQADVPRSIDRRSETQRIAAMGISLDPPGADQNPQISGEEAIRRAWEEDPWPSASSIRATFSLFSNSQFGDESTGKALSQRPTWEVVYTGVCVPGHGPISQEPEAPVECIATEEHVMLDAANGEFLLSYATSDE